MCYNGSLMLPMIPYSLKQLFQSHHPHSLSVCIIQHLEALVRDTHNMAMIVLQKFKEKGFQHGIFFLSVVKPCFGLGTDLGSYSKKCSSRLYMFKDDILWAYWLSMMNFFFYQLPSRTPLPDTWENSNTLWWSGLNSADTDTGNVFQFWVSFKMKKYLPFSPLLVKRNDCLLRDECTWGEMLLLRQSLSVKKWKCHHFFNK